MVELEAHIVGHVRTSALNVDICPFVHSELLEHQAVPVHIRIDVFIDSVSCAGYLDVAVFWSGIGRAHLLGIVVGLHEGDSICVFHYIDRLEEGVLIGDVDFRLGVLGTGQWPDAEIGRAHV